MIATSSSKHLVLIGTGRPHLQVMRGLARGTTNLRVTLAAPHPWYVDAAMLPGYVGGQWSREQVCRSVEHLIRMSGATFLPSRPLALDAANRRIQLSSGDALHYDVLSINEEGALERETLERIVPGARANALSVHPCSAFVQLWPQVLALSRTRALRVAIVGNGALAFELALAAAQAMGHPYRSRITIIAGEEGILPGEPQALRRRANRSISSSCRFMSVSQPCRQGQSGARPRCPARRVQSRRDPLAAEPCLPIWPESARPR